MDDVLTTRHGFAVAEGATPAEEARVFHDMVIRTISKLGGLPDGVLWVDFRFGEDSGGSPAVWIVFRAHDDLNPSQEKLAQIQRFAREIRSGVRESGSERWPYVDIATG
jgi:hypothetical protein